MEVSLEFLNESHIALKCSSKMMRGGGIQLFQDCLFGIHNYYKNMSSINKRGNISPACLVMNVLVKPLGESSGSTIIILLPTCLTLKHETSITLY